VLGKEKLLVMEWLKISLSVLELAIYKRIAVQFAGKAKNLIGPMD
jgi:hypothetical protein